MHRPRRADHFAAANFRDALVPEANPEDWPLAAQVPHDLIADPRLARGARSRRDADAGRAHFLNPGDGNLIVSPNDRFDPELAEILHEIVGERIVVIDDQQLGHSALAVARAIASSAAFALLTVSRYSLAGSESATIPAPAWT